MHHLLTSSDLELVFQNAPGMCLILDPAFRVLAQNDAHMHATMTTREETVGRLLFEIFPDNPNDPNADGLAELRASLVTVVRTRKPHMLPNLRFDIQPQEGVGGYQTRYWRVVNTPILGEDGFVRLIINHVQDLTSALD